jgi:hypothetical protein
VYHGGQILNTTIGVGYGIGVACIFSTDDIISLDDLRIQIHTSLELLHNHFNLPSEHKLT